MPRTSMIDRLNAVLGERYTIERELGSGGMATVYLARDLKHDRDVALKVLKREYDRESEAARIREFDRLIAELAASVVGGWRSAVSDHCEE